MKIVRSIIEYFKTNDFGITLLFLVFLFLADYSNIFGYFGFNFSNINVGMWNVVIIFVIFYLSYIYIDLKNGDIERERIKQEKERIDREKDLYDKIACTKQFLLTQTYVACLGAMSYTSSESFKTLMSQKSEYNKRSGLDEIITNISNLPFENDSKIMELALDGYLSNDELNEYFTTKFEFRDYMRSLVSSSDYKDDLEEMSNQLMEKINILSKK